MDINEVVRERYARAAVEVGEFGCCGSPDTASMCSPGRCDDPISSNLYDSGQKSELPEQALARENQRQSGLENVEFLTGDIESIPLPDNSVDVIISNCVINLSGDKDRVLREAFRVLSPGGRLAACCQPGCCS